ncbi:phosphohistidine phosphatase [Acrocarpospora phusangensis]|uniref:Phosphohistidine phosphatase n=1 Tax=Acrocarpospora phusangensis TaxID=1070424 RepID=A0A919Q9W0_9ACTN|nr:histidine phosphatase family protein [Acrocarpospora phusangensis]GIH22497.1 phosphohistidine phosphatase [Acrocarpospora phusangensis]
MKTLIVLRHAKAEHTPGVLDFERGLTNRGQRNAREAGELIGRLEPDLILSSSSKRTRQTAELLGLPAPLELERDIYEAYADELLVLLRQVGPDVGTLVLVGHNPSVHELVIGLTGHQVETFPPGAYAVIELPGPWAEVDSGTGTLVDTHRP